MYVAAQKSLAGRDINLGEQAVRRSHPMFMPFGDWIPAMDFSADEVTDLNGILSHVVAGLLREGLIEDEFRFGKGDTLGLGKDISLGGGIVYRITLLGIELFASAHGIRSDPRRAFLDPATPFDLETPMKTVGASGLVNDLQPQQAS